MLADEICKIWQLHVYEVSPVLTTIEKQTSRALAALFGLKGPYAGGVTQPGGSASNATAVVVARNCLYPKSKVSGYQGKKFVLFTSEQGHYSFEKAAMMCGLGSSNAWKVPSDEKGRMKPAELQRLVSKARTEGFLPFFVNATAGTTVLGAYDPLPEIAAICRQESLWFHVDGSWGASVIFSAEHKHKMRGAELANSLTVNPHKMLGVPLTCSFLLTADLRKFKQANSLPAGYLFHDTEGASSAEINDSLPTFPQESADEFWDLGDLTLQCGRKGDSLKLALSWTYYGSSGYSDKIDHAFTVASYCADLVAANEDLLLISSNPPPCLQVCFYFAPGGVLAQGKDANSKMTAEIAKRLPQKGFMVDYAPGEFGFFFRLVVHLGVEKETIERLVTAVVQIGVDISRSKTVQVS